LGFFREHKRKRLRTGPFPEVWRTILEDHAPYYQVLPVRQRERLHGHIQILRAEKHFEGCGGLELEDLHCIIVAAYAGVLLLGQDRGFYPNLRSILIYPGAFLVNQHSFGPAGEIADETEVREGESWGLGAIVLSWEDIKRDLKVLNGRNILFHEFAHQLYDAASTDWMPRGEWRTWLAVFEEHYIRHCQLVEAGRSVFFDAYGAEDASEFFAVATEAFFERPQVFRRKFPAFYEQFRTFYQQDPYVYFYSQSG